MRTTLLPLLLLIALLAVTACEKEGIETTTHYTRMMPVFALRGDIHDSIQTLEPRLMCHPGAIYARGRYLFVGELDEGFHVIDNSDPEAPTPVAFWQVPGSSQISFVGNRVVMDSYADVVVLSIGNDFSIQLDDFAPNALATGGRVGQGHQDEVVVGYRMERVSYHYEGPYSPYGCDACDFAGGPRLNAFESDSDPGGGIDLAGSLSRFAVSGDYLYVLDQGQIRPFTVGADSIDVHDAVYVAWDIETAVARADYLYLGSATGMHVLDLSDPSAPLPVANYRHVRGCDPVAVDGDRAVVTVRDGTDCGSDDALNTLTVLDISDPTNPVELAVHSMLHPHGVAILGERVYVCEGDFGLRSYDFDGDRRQLGQLVAEHEMTSRDVIALPYTDAPVIFTISEHGMQQHIESPSGDLRHASQLGGTPCR